MSTGETITPGSQGLEDRVLYTLVTGLVEHPESIPAGLFRAQGFATDPENTKITDEQRVVVKERLADMAVRLEARLPAKVVKDINTDPKPAKATEPQ